MSGTKAGGQKAAATNKAKYGAEFYAKIGAAGGKKGHNGGFASNEVGADGLTGRQRAGVAGALGGHISKRKAWTEEERVSRMKTPVVAVKKHHLLETLHLRKAA